MKLDTALSLVLSSVARRRGALGAAAALAVALVAPGCTKQQLQGASSSYLIVESFLAASGATPGQFGGVLSSDVQTKGSVFQDLGQVSLSLALKDPGRASTPSQPTTANFITVTRYHVKFVRSDGRNTQGVDVPYEFDGASTFTVGGSATNAIFTLVRAQAKAEAPLRSLVGGGVTGIISTLAEVTFYGTDQAGREVSVTALISVNFADWAD